MATVSSRDGWFVNCGTCYLVVIYLICVVYAEESRLIPDGSSEYYQMGWSRNVNLTVVFSWGSGYNNMPYNRAGSYRHVVILRLLLHNMLFSWVL